MAFVVHDSFAFALALWEPGSVVAVARFAELEGPLVRAGL